MGLFEKVFKAKEETNTSVRESGEVKNNRSVIDMSKSAEKLNKVLINR